MKHSTTNSSEINRRAMSREFRRLTSSLGTGSTFFLLFFIFMNKQAFALDLVSEHDCWWMNGRLSHNFYDTRHCMTKIFARVYRMCLMAIRIRDWRNIREITVASMITGPGSCRQEEAIVGLRIREFLMRTAESFWGQSFMKFPETDELEFPIYIRFMKEK